MKQIFIILFIMCLLPAFSKTITGEITKETSGGNVIYDIENNQPVDNALIKIPAEKFKTRTDKNGAFQLNTTINAPAIMTVEKNGYKPYSMTLGKSDNTDALNIGIEKTAPNDIIVETDMIHIGDDSFSTQSANAGDFCLKSTGAFYSKDFNVKNMNADEELFIVIGSIIGIDTIESQRMNQSHVTTAYSSAPELFFNGSKIAEIKINGDNQKIKVPSGLIKFNKKNNITLKTGRNLYKTSAVDYDDIEFTNLLLEVK